jgi:hypothetical protein
VDLLGLYLERLVASLTDGRGIPPKDPVDLPTTRTRPRLEWADSSKACLYRFGEQH